MPKRVGMDFDGFIANTHQAKVDLIERLFNVAIPIEKCRHDKLLLEKDPKLLEYYRRAQELIYEQRVYSDQVQPMPGCLRRLRQLAREGNEMYVLSSRSPEAARLAMQWLEKYDIPRLGVQFVAVGRDGSKERVSHQRKLDIYFDDDLEKLVYMKANMTDPPELYLFRQPHNRLIEPPDGIKVVDSWASVCKRISSTNLRKVG